jgi:hypothetical protein
VLMSKKHQPVRNLAKASLPIRSRSKLKQAILEQLRKDPHIKIQNLCYRVDARGDAEALSSWRAKSTDRTLCSVLKAGGKERHALESYVSKLRNVVKKGSIP